MNQIVAKSIFQSKTIQGALITLVSTNAILGVNCIYENRPPNKTETLAGLASIVAFSWTLVGRGQNSPVYTPDALPGANQSDFVEIISEDNKSP